MDPVDVTEAVWSHLIRCRTNGVREPMPAWTDAEREAWSLYEPLARGKGPLIFAQVGQSLDGRIATVSGDAQDVSGPEGLCHLHRCRALADAVVIGARTALLDNPRLTVRLVEGRSPARVVIDPNGRLPDSAAVLRDDGARRLVIQATDTPRPDGVEVIRLSAEKGWIEPASIVGALQARGLPRLLIEGGGVTIAKFLEAGLLHRLHVAVAPLIIGAGPTGLRTAPVSTLAEALRPETRVFFLGSDVIFDCQFQSGSASTSQWPTRQEVRPAAAASRRL